MNMITGWFLYCGPINQAFGCNRYDYWLTIIFWSNKPIFWLPWVPFIGWFLYCRVRCKKFWTTSGMVQWLTSELQDTVHCTVPWPYLDRRTCIPVCLCTLTTAKMLVTGRCTQIAGQADPGLMRIISRKASHTWYIRMHDTLPDSNPRGQCTHFALLHIYSRGKKK